MHPDEHDQTGRTGRTGQIDQIAAVIKVARQGYEHDELVRQVAQMQRCTWAEAEYLVQQVEQQHGWRVQSNRLLFLLTFPLLSLTGVVFLWLSVGDFALLVALGGLLMLGAAVNFDFTMFVPHRCYERLEMWHFGSDYQEYRTTEHYLRQQRRYGVAANLLGSTLVFLGLVLGITSRLFG